MARKSDGQDLVQILGSSAEQVQAVEAAEKQHISGDLLMCSSYLSSVYFPDSAIQRYFGRGGGNEVLVGRRLAERRETWRATLPIGRRELYEAEAFTALIQDGIVHAQEPAFRLRPSEIVDTLTQVVSILDGYAKVQIAITSQVVPIVFVVASDLTVVDIRANYAYQPIQSILIRGQHAARQFTEAFDTLWHSTDTISDKYQVRSLLASAVSQWSTNGRLSVADWPLMRRSSRPETRRQ
jgi:hypothetical protein